MNWLAELRRRLRQLDVLLSILTRAEEEGDDVRGARVAASIGETKERIHHVRNQVQADSAPASAGREV